MARRAVGLARCRSSCSRTVDGRSFVRALLEVGHDGRRRQRRRVQQVRDDVFPAQHRRRAVGHRRHRQDAAVAEQAAPVRIGHRHAAEARAVDAADAVVPRQPLVDERVVGVEQVERGRFSRTMLAKSSSVSRRNAWRTLSSKSGEQQDVRRDLVQVAQLQPLPGERVHQRVGARVGDHAPHLRLEHAGRAQPARRSPGSAARRPGCCSRGRTTAGSPARAR